MPASHHKHRSTVPGQLVLFDILDQTGAAPGTLAEPGTTLSYIGPDGEAQNELQLFPEQTWPPASQRFDSPAIGDGAVRSEQPGPEWAAAKPSADIALTEHVDPDEDPPILSHSVRVARHTLPDGPTGTDHVCTPADFIHGPVARFDANLAALALLKQLEVEGRAAKPDEKAILARFSGFGDSVFEPAFRLNPGRPDEHAWVERGQRLRSLVTDAEWRSLERSRLNAFFTSPGVIAAIWDGLRALGLDTLDAPRILEPAAGVGRFLGLQPTGSASRSARTAIELDGLTARLLKALYPRSVVHQSGLQDTPLRDDSYDVAISNVPFGDFPVVDQAYLKPGQRFLTRSIHNYFFAKSLTKIRPGGILAFITSRYTLDAATAAPIRQWLYQDADLVAAARLPAGTFPDTDVVTDLVILRKRLPAESSGDGTWLDSVSRTYQFQAARPFEGRYERLEQVETELNAYYLANPDMVLGTHGTTSVMYGGAGYTVRLPEGGSQAVVDQLHQRMRALPPGRLEPAPGRETSSWNGAASVASKELKEGAYVLVDDALRVCRGGQLIKPPISPSQTARIRSMLAVRDSARAALRAQLDSAAPHIIEETQRRLNSVYDHFIRRFGPLNAPANVAAMGADPDAFFLRALERWDTEAQQHHRTGRPVMDAAARHRLKMPLFFDIVVRQARAATSARSAKDACLIVLSERGSLDFARMSELLSTSAEAVRDELATDGLIFDDPETGWHTADAYLSGNVKRKLAVAEKAALAEQRFDRNVEALRAIVPGDIPPGQIEVRLGTHWIPPTDVNRFLGEVLDAEEPRWSRTGNQFVRYVGQTADWVLETEPLIPAARNFGDWGTHRASSLSIVLELLNGRLPSIVDELADGRRVVNQQETLAAQEKAEALQRRFSEWLWSDAERAERLARYYNDTFNAIRSREFDGSHLTLPGSNPAFSLRPHQKAAVWRVLQESAVGLFHEVGAGKTTVMAAAAMELRRLGLARKVMIVVPNDILQQFAQEFQRFYPLARLLVPGKDDFTPARRNEFMARIATGDWDSVIVAQSQFTLLPVNPETEAAFIEHELGAYREALEEMADEARDGGTRSWRSSQKSIQKAIQRLSARLLGCQKRLEERKRLTQTMTFEDLGIDRLFVDEAHWGKNLPFATRLDRVKGLPNPGECQRATDLFLKTQRLLERGGGIVFATGTPIANTIAESWTMARYLMRHKLEELGLQHFDAWAKLFADTVVTLEQTVTGAYRPTARFARFKNVPEWLQLFQLTADIRMGSELPELERLKPRLVGGDVPGKRIYRTAEATPDLLGFMERLAKRVEDLGPPVKGGDNMLKIASDARKAALDMRLVSPGALEHPRSKLNLAADEIAAVYRNTEADHGIQLVFLDLGTPKAVDVARAREDDAVLVDSETHEEIALLTDVYAELKRKLTARGLPANEIRFVHEAKTRDARAALFQTANDGDIRVLIGSTAKLGTGVNVQKRLAALHHLDAPWRPMDLEQRDGRGLRQGNVVFGPALDTSGTVIDRGRGIRIFVYLTARSFDGYVFQAIEAKARGFKAILRRSVAVRVIEDVDEVVLSAAEAKALVAGDPDVLKRVQLQTEIVKLEALRAAHVDQQVQARWELKRLPQRIAELRARGESIAADVAFRNAHVARPGTVGEGSFSFAVDGHMYADRVEAAPEFAAAIVRQAELLLEEQASCGPSPSRTVADYRGFRVTVRAAGAGSVRLGLLCPGRTDALEYATGRTLDVSQIPAYGVGVFQRLDHLLDALDSELKAAQDGLTREETNLASYTAQLARPFEHDESLLAARRELARIERNLTCHGGTGGPPTAWTDEAQVRMEAAA